MNDKKFNSERELLTELATVSGRMGLTITDLHLVSTSAIRETVERDIFHLPDHNLYVALAKRV